MKITCAKSELMKSIGIVMKAVPVRTTMTILECILIDAKSNIITFTANDMELGIETQVTGLIQERGMVALDAKIFSEIIRKLPDNDVTISTDERMNTTIVCEKAKFCIMGKEGDDFSRLPFIEKNESIVLSQFSLKEIIRQTLFSAAQNDTNKVITGELFEIRNNHLRVVALDGHRISIRTIEMKEDYPDQKVIVPGKTLSEISKILSGETQDLVHIYITTNHMMFEFDQTVVVSRLIEGSYFRVDQMISGDYETKVRMNRRELIESLDRSILLVNENDKKPIILNMENDVMDISISSQMGSLNEKIDIEMEGKTLKIGFNPKFIMDALRVIDDERIDLYFINSKAPCVIRDSESSYVYLILPVNFVS